MVFFTKYQWWFVGISILMQLAAHYITWKRKSLLPKKHFIILWISTLITIGSVLFVLYTYGYFA
jgi:hypothetical protein